MQVYRTMLDRMQSQWNEIRGIHSLTEFKTRCGEVGIDIHDWDEDDE